LFIQYSDRIIKPGLERIKFFLAKLGNPQKKFNTILVGGTNGKGSTVSFLFHTLQAQGVKVGAYLSPHLYRLEERILLSAPKSYQLTAVVAEMERMATKWNIELSPFELLTSAVFVLFSNCGIELALLEVGMGGRWDATNITSPLVSIITSLGLDHTQYLGPDLASIAMEKFHIARKGRPLILGNIPQKGLKVLRQKGRALGAFIFEWNKDFFSLDRGPKEFCYVGDGVVPEVRLSMEGDHQRINASLALRTLEALKFPINGGVLRGLMKTWLPGRMQIEEVEGVPVILDVAHNLLALQVFISFVRRRFVNRPIWAFLRLLQDKPWMDLLKTALENFEEVYFLEIPDDDGREVSIALVPDGIPVKPLNLRRQGIEILERAKEMKAVLVFTGSFGAVREALNWVNGEK